MIPALERLQQGPKIPGQPGLEAKTLSLNKQTNNNKGNDSSREHSHTRGEDAFASPEAGGRQGTTLPKNMAASGLSSSPASRKKCSLTTT